MSVPCERLTATGQETHIAIMKAIRATKKRLCVDLVHEDEQELDALLRVLSHRQPLRAGPVERTLAT
jgi:hypothetical protein